MSVTIAELAAAGKINATSCMTLMPGWPEDSALLRDLPPHAETGLHLTLTGERPLTAMPSLAPDGTLPTIQTLHRLAGRGQLPIEEIAAEIRAQFDAFEAAMGRPPAFVDGHQHAHALPGIREIALAETARRQPDAWVRDCSDRIGAMLSRPFFGKAIGSAFHSRGLALAIRKYGLRRNTSFAGHYDFASDYRKLFPKFLRRPGDVHLVMCHPGAGRRPDDAIAGARVLEADALREWPISGMAAAEGLAFPV